MGGLAKTKFIGQGQAHGSGAAVLLPPTTWCAWAASAAGGTRIMREPGIRAPEMGEWPANRPDWMLIAAQTRLGPRFFENSVLMRSMPLFQTAC